MDKTLSIITTYTAHSPKGLSEKMIKNSYPSDYENIINRYSHLDIKFPEKLYLYIHNLDTPPQCQNPSCNNFAKFISIQQGYRNYCSHECFSKDPKSVLRREETCIKKYGVKNPSQSDDIKDKRKQTTMERYGVENVFESQEIKNKIKKYYNDNYGVDYPSQSVEIQETRKSNSFNKYGVDHHMKVQSIREKIANSNRSHAISNIDGLIGYDSEGQWIMSCPHPECNKCLEKNYLIFSDQAASRKAFNIEPCTRLLPIKNSHNKSTTFELFIHRILDKHNIEYITNDRTILDGKEVDIYIPSKNIAIECNGLPWHAVSRGKGMYYHIDKYKGCKDKGIQLITIWYDQYIHHPEIVESIILSKLGIYEARIYARKCVVKEVDSKTTRLFLENNHIQGRTNASVHIGLYYNDELVGVMTFANGSKLSGSKNVKKEDWELNRFCTKINTQVVGGADKLLKYFIKNYKPKTITSFSSNDISNGSLYKRLGFETDNKITTAYWYISHKDYIRYHRTSFTKNRLEKMGYDIDGKTEDEIMRNLPYFKIYDSGHIKHTLLIDNSLYI